MRGVWYNVWYMANYKPDTSKLSTKGGYKKTLKDNRVALFKAFFIDPKSDSFQNTMRSAIKAGYSYTYAHNLTVQRPAWFQDMLQDSEVARAEMLGQAEKALKNAINYDDSDKEYAKMKLQASTFVSERLGKDLYSMRNEVTGANGRRLIPNETRASQKISLASLFKGVQDATAQ
jgi:hypothetical protein